MFSAIVLGLMAIGVVLALAASPSAAHRLDIDDPLYFFRRHLVAVGVSSAALLIMASLPVRLARRACFAVLGLGLLGLALTPIFGVDVNGATRWLRFGPVSVQPIELVKPSFVALSAMAIAASSQRDGPAGLMVGSFILLAIIGALAIQPDLGQIALLCAAFCATAVVSGVSWWIVIAAGVAASGGIVLAMLNFPYAAERIRTFLEGETVYQVERVRAAFANGGWFGVGPGEGVVKYTLPDGHADYILAVAAEEYGAVFVAALTLAFAALVWRGTVLGARTYRPEHAAAVTSLTALIGLHAAIHAAVNLDLVPAKGMTLPFVSYGGSSLLGSAFAVGLILTLSRRLNDVEAGR